MAGQEQRVESWVPLGRALHLIDIENLLGFAPAEATDADYISAAARYADAVSPAVGDHFVVGCNPANAFKAMLAFPNAHLVVGHGPDGGEAAILSATCADHVARSYDRVYIGSGDCAFTWLAYELGDRDVDVSIVSLKRSLSHRLARAADAPIFIDSSPPAPGVQPVTAIVRRRAPDVVRRRVRRAHPANANRVVN